MAVASTTSPDYLPIATATLSAKAVLNCDLFSRRGGTQFLDLFRGTDYPLEQTDIDQLRAEGVDRLYIRFEDRTLYEDYVRRELLHGKEIAAPLRLKALRELTRVTFDQALRQPTVEKVVNVAADFGRDLALIASNHSIVFQELLGTLDHDYYTFTHVCNVSVYVVMIAKQMGIPASQWHEIASGALLHDLGKKDIPPAVLNKPGALTDEEWQMVRDHPLTGFRLLMHHEQLGWPQLMMVYQHHERMDGTGYPVGVEADELHPWSRICSVADVFDALTCHRSYRRALTPAEACDRLQQQAGTAFDPDVVACWLAQIRSKS